MIAYEELAAALERWRIRNGLPGTPPLFADGPRKTGATAATPSYTAPAASYAPPAVAYAPPAATYAPPAATYAPPAPRTAPPSPPPPAPSPETIDEDLAEADVLDEDHLDNDGPDFAMAFSDAPAAPLPRAAHGLTADEEREASLLGSTDPGLVPPPLDDEEEGDDVWPEASAFASGPVAGPGPGRASATVVDDDDDDDGGTLVNG